MTSRKRIVLNIAATYGRSLFALACGLLAGRWTLMALGAVDFGLYGLVAGIVAVIAFFNSVLSLAVGRFYAFEVGRSDSNEVCKWFSTAVLLHLVVAALVASVGWPVGERIVQSVLSIPSERVTACLWTLRISLFGAVVGILTVPYQAMYTAKQKIAEVTVYEVVGTALKTLALFFMASSAGDWLVPYAGVMAIATIVPNLLIAGHAAGKFAECRLEFKKMCNRERIAAFLHYAVFECFGSGAVVAKNSGGAILVNEYLGPAYNGAMSFANSVGCHTATLSSSLTTAFYPAITNAYGAGNMGDVRRLAFGACKLGAVLVLLFAIPLSLEVDYVFGLWLKEPPPGTTVLCLYVLATTFVDRLTTGGGLAINASGRIAKYQLFCGSALMLAFPLIWLALDFEWGVHGIGIASLFAFSLNGLAKLFFARRIVGMGIGTWAREVMFPVGAVLVVSLAIGFGVRGQFESSFLRVVLVSLSTSVPIGFQVWKWKRFI